MADIYSAVSTACEKVLDDSEGGLASWVVANTRCHCVDDAEDDLVQEEGQSCAMMARGAVGSADRWERPMIPPLLEVAVLRTMA